MKGFSWRIAAGIAARMRLLVTRRQRESPGAAVVQATIAAASSPRYSTPKPEKRGFDRRRAQHGVQS
jgi:hypothetical protein